MKLLFDENLSYRLPMRLADVAPGGRHVRSATGRGAADLDIARWAEENGFVIVTCDQRLVNEIAALKRRPKVIVLRLRNPRLAEAEAFLRQHLEAIVSFSQDTGADVLVLHPRP